ncbi:MAG: aspartate 1-decarboxylase [bacterium]
MQRMILASKIHRAVVTDAHVDYEGSLTIDEALMEAAGFRPYEKILVGNQANGERFETYAIVGKRGSGCICLNGATAHLGKKGDRLTIMSFASMTEAERQKHVPQVIVVDEKNRVKRSSY